MPLCLAPYTPEWTAAARDFNARLLAARAPVDFGLPNDPSSVHYLVTDGDKVRGGCLVAPEAARVGSRLAEVASIQSPLSEGLFDPAYASVAPWMMREIIRRWPLAYSVGMGSAERPYPRLLKALRWKLVPVPFYFRVFRGDRVVSQMPALRRRASARLLGAVPVLASLAFRLLHRFRGGHRKAVALDALTAFSGHETQIWNKVRAQLTFALLRDSDTLNERYRNRAAEGISFARFASGYLVVKLHQFTADTQFGSLRVATWADGAADPGHESELAAASEQLAASLGADLLITNQLYAPLQNALQANGWLSYPSNFLVAWSPQLARELDPATSYVNRRDGDGLVHL